MADVIARIGNARLEAQIRFLGFDTRIYKGEDIRRFVFNALVSDIRAGETRWPVDTGFSRASFFTDGRTLRNEAPYARFLEYKSKKHKRAIRDYIDRNLRDLVLAALELINASPRDPSQPQDTFELASAGADEALLASSIDLYSPSPTYGDLSARQRRLLRTYQPGNLFGSLFDSPLVIRRRPRTPPTPPPPRPTPKPSPTPRPPTALERGRKRFNKLFRKGATRARNAKVVRDLNAGSEAWAAVVTQAENAAIHEYTGTHYTYVNATLRGLYSPPADALADVRRITKNVNAGIAKYTGERPPVVWRGLSADVGIQNLKAGAIFEETAFMSTSLDPRTAVQAFAKSDGIVMEIIPKSGAAVERLSANMGENEWLMPSGRRLRFVQVRRGKVDLAFGQQEIDFYQFEEV